MVFSKAPGFLLVTLVFLNGSAVSGARQENVVVPPERDQGLLPRTLSSLAYRLNLGSRAGLRAHDSRLQDVHTAKGVKYRRMVETYGGYEVYGSTLSVELSLDGQFTGQVSGNVVRGLAEDIPDPEVCKRNLSHVLAVALGEEGFSLGDGRTEEPGSRRIVYVRPDSRGTLAYLVDFFIQTPGHLSRPQYIIDACDDTVYGSHNLVNTAGVLSSFSRVQKAACGECGPSVPGYGGNVKTGRTTYNVPPRCLPVEGTVDCRMITSYGGVVNNMGTEDLTRSNVIDFKCSEGYDDPYGNPNGAFGIANDALYFANIAGGFFVNKYSFKAIPWIPKVAIHYGRNLENAFWTGTNMYFGDGDTDFHPFVILDIVAHEMAHGITSTNSNLEYENQSGGINEAFSDISAAVVKYYVRNKIDWLVGAYATKNTEAHRYFEDPTRDGVSIKDVQDYRVGMNVHYSSGVFNHAFYRMVAIHNMPIYDAYKCFLDANRNRWGVNTDFLEGACHVARACYADGYDHNSVISAFSRVGISLGSCSLSLRSGTVYAGQSRPSILVSATRHPILEVSLDKGQSSLEVTAEDSSDVSLLLAGDEGATQVLARGTNRLHLTSDLQDKLLYVKLTSNNKSDTNVTLKVKTL